MSYRGARCFLLAGVALAVLPAAAAAQPAPPPPSDERPPAAGGDGFEEEGEEIVVTGTVPRGSVMGDIKPEQTLTAGDVRSFGVSSVAELLDELAPQTNAGGGPPVVLLNGKRISGFQEIRDIPAEAISRVEVLPEEVSLKYGYAANQKVVNIVLRQRFRAVTAEARAGTTTDGGRENGRAEADLLRIRGDNRFSLDAEYSRAGRLLESDRDILTTPARAPYSLAGNVAPSGGAADIDPALSALAGRPVTVAAVPGSAASGRPALADFVAGANAAGSSDLGRYRTLSPSTENLTLNATLARALGGVSGSLNGRVELTDSDSLQGLPAAGLLLPAGNPFSPFTQPVQLYRYLGEAEPLGQSVKGVDAHLGLALNGSLRPWQWSFTGSYDWTERRTATDRGIDTGGIQAALVAGDVGLNPFGSFGPDLLATTLTDRARARTSALAGDLLLSGPLFELPAGRVTTSIRLAGSSNDFASRSLRSGLLRTADYDRDIASGQASIDVPIASRRNGTLAAIGDLSVNGNVAFQRFSDFGTLTNVGYGLRWTPIPQVRLIASMNQERTAPTGQQINDPVVVTPNFPVFDYATGRTVFVTQTSGGNVGLQESDRHVMRLALTLRPLEKQDLALTATYTRARTDRPIAGFPSPTPQIEAAFRDRFVRDEDGGLLSIDARPINFAQSRSSQLRWGFNFSKPIKSRLQREVEAWRAAGARPEDRPADLRALFEGRGRRGQGGTPGAEPGAGGDARPAGAPERRDDGASATGSGQRPEAGFGGGERGPGGGGRFGGGGFGRGGGSGGGGGGRLQFALYHTWRFTDSVEIGPSVPKLDLLGGDAIGPSGGQSRHEIEAQAGYTNNGFGIRGSADWQSATRVDGALGSPDGSLRFSDLATFNLRLFANFGQMPQLVRDHPFLRGARLTLSVNNLFNARQDVSDGTGSTPLRYQPGYLDPLGRTVTISFRKLFFSRPQRPPAR